MFRSGVVHSKDDVTDAENVADVEGVVRSKTSTARARGTTFVAGGLGRGGQTLTKNVWQVCLGFLPAVQLML